MKNYVSIISLLLCVTTYSHTMEQKNPLFDDALTEVTLGNIQDQLRSAVRIEYSEPSETEPLTKIGPGLMDEILLENKQTFCSPTHNDFCHPKKLAIKAGLTLIFAGLIDGGFSGLSALLLAGSGSSPALVCTPACQGVIAFLSCGVSCGRNGACRLVNPD